MRFGLVPTCHTGSGPAHPRVGEVTCSPVVLPCPLLLTVEGVVKCLLHFSRQSEGLQALLCLSHFYCLRIQVLQTETDL